jgi:hypothetical protein
MGEVEGRKGRRTYGLGEVPDDGNGLGDPAPTVEARVHHRSPGWITSGYLLPRLASE